MFLSSHTGKKKQQINPKCTQIRRKHTQGQSHSYLVVNYKPQCIP